MGIREINDDHASNLSHIREVRGVVDRLRQLYAAAFEADQASGEILTLDRVSGLDGPQPAPGR